MKIKAVLMAFLLVGAIAATISAVPAPVDVPPVETPPVQAPPFEVPPVKAPPIEAPP